MTFKLIVDYLQIAIMKIIIFVFLLYEFIININLFLFLEDLDIAKI